MFDTDFKGQIVFALWR